MTLVLTLRALTLVFAGFGLAHCAADLKPVMFWAFWGVLTFNSFLLIYLCLADLAGAVSFAGILSY